MCKIYTIKLEGTLSEIIGLTIKNLRKKNGIGQDDMSELTGISRPSISNIEVGRHNLTVKNLEKLCKMFDCKSSDILPF